MTMMRWRRLPDRRRPPGDREVERSRDHIPHRDLWTADPSALRMLFLDLFIFGNFRIHDHRNFDFLFQNAIKFVHV